MFTGIKRAIIFKFLNNFLAEEVHNMNSNMKTTTLGILAIIAAGAGAGIQLLEGHSPDWTALIAAISAGWGLIAAKDAK